jgi:AcrR family transcriptional regulator
MQVTGNELAIYRILGKEYTLPYRCNAGKTKEHTLMASTILFCIKGYEGITMREIAKEVGITAAALYNHFRSKADLWNAVLDHAMELYSLYHSALNEQLEKTDCFESALDLILHEPSQMRNLFTCYAFSLIQTEQFRDKRAGEIFTETFLKYDTQFHKDWFDAYIQRGLVRPFDTNLVATLLTQCTLTTISLRVHAAMNNAVPYNREQLYCDFKKWVMRAVSNA